MKRKVLIEKKENHVWTFFLEEDQIAEIHCAKSDEQEKVHQIGDIYVAKVQNIVQNIGAAFLEIEPGVNCYFDLRDAQNAFFTHKIGKKPLCIGDELVVQISREAVKTKVPTVTGNISLTGRYAVLTHGNTRIGVSSKISKKDREAYKERLQEYQNDQYGLIIRTNAKDAAFEDVLTEIEQLKAEYEHLLKYAASRVCFSCLKSAPPSYITDLKNVYMDGMEEILVNDAEIYEKICSYFKKEMPENLELVHFHDDSGYPLGKIYSTETAVEHALAERVWLKHGGYLVIQVTEALTVIDVNSGKNVRKKGDDESTLKMNLEAAKETARQIRLRNLSGIILIDFINQDEEKNEETLLKEFRYFLAKDPIQTTLVDITGKIVIADDILIYAAGTLVVLTYAELVAWMNSPAGRKLANDITSVIVDGITFTGNIISVTRQWVNSTRTELVEAAKVYFEKAGCDKKQGKDNKKEKSQKSGASDGEKTPESNPEDFTKLKNGQGYKDKKGNIWKKDQLHKDHWDVSDPKGKKVKEVDFDGRKIWPGGPKNKNK